MVFDHLKLIKGDPLFRDAWQLLAFLTVADDAIFDVLADGLQLSVWPQRQIERVPMG
jgi:hypothetical protein